MNLFELLKSTSDELPGFLSASIVSLDSGLPLATVANVDDDDAAAADAFHSDVYRTVLAALAELGAEQSVEGVVIEGDDSTCISLPLGDSGYFWHIVTQSRTTLGFTQAVMRKHKDAVAAGIHELFS